VEEEGKAKAERGATEKGVESEEDEEELDLLDLFGVPTGVLAEVFLPRTLCSPSPPLL
jgi:hypothetical protein